MTQTQKIIKYLAFALAILLIISIFSGILGVLSIIGGFTSEDGVDPDINTISVSGPVDSLNVNINAADFTIKPADQFYVASNLSKLNVEQRNGTLYLTEKSRGNFDYQDAVLILGVPKDYFFEDVRINTGAGQLSADCICANKLTLDLGAGRTDIGILNASEWARIGTGAGEVVVRSGTIRNMDLDMGVGKLELTARLTCQSELDLGIGETVLKLMGTASDYRLDVEKGIGDVTVDGQHITGDQTIGAGKDQVEINCGVGSVKITLS